MPAFAPDLVGVDPPQGGDPAPQPPFLDEGASGDEDGEGDDGDDDGRDDDAPELMAGPDGRSDEDAGDEEAEPEEVDADETARLAALAADLDAEAPDEAPEGEIEVARIDEDALKVVRRLHHFGYEAYLVGGCVRDLLLGRQPKDFDVATSAEPPQIRQVFRNCRLIGRRFRLAHIYFNAGKVVETSTFRANPLDEMDDLPKDLLISQDNVFGTSEEDARRRDFTVNALFYDPRTGKVVDHVGGRVDLDARVIRTIGDPHVRLREDPVRILRAVKFAARLGFTIDPTTRDAMTCHAREISRCAAPRVLEEIYRLLSSGAAKPAFSLLLELGLVPVLFPELASALGCAEGGDAAAPPDEAALRARTEMLSVLDALDACRQRGVTPSHALCMATMLLRLYLRMQATGQDANRWLDEMSAALVARLRFTRRDRDRVRVILQAQRHLAPDRRRGGAAKATVRRGAFLEALLLYTIHLLSSGGDLAEVGQWKALARVEGQPFRPGEVAEREVGDPGEGNGRRGGSRGHSRGRSGDSGRRGGASTPEGSRRREKKHRRGGRRGGPKS
jgi:poly(A) polymerase